MLVVQGTIIRQEDAMKKGRNIIGLKTHSI